MSMLGKIMWGLILVALGVVLALNALNLTEIDVFFDGWWTVFLIVPCFIGLFTERKKTGNLIGLLIGVLLLLACQDVLSFEIMWKLMLPAVIVLIGLRLLIGAVVGKRPAGKTDDRSGIQRCFAAFSGKTVRAEGEAFAGAELTAVFGGVTFDLRQAVLTGDTVIDACAVFGGIDILLPPEIKVKVNSDSLFGGVSNKRSEPVNQDGGVTLCINASCIFGGVDIK